MAPQDQTRLRVVGPDDESVAARQQKAEKSILDDPERLNELVDRVVDRIERRVVDELERRGRRYGFGAF